MENCELSIIPALNFIYHSEPSFMVTRLEFKDEIDRTVMEMALAQTFQSMPYFTNAIHWEGDVPYWKTVEAPIRVFPGSPLKEIYEKNPYPVSVFCERKTVYLLENHALSDAPGYAFFETNLMNAYCNLKYDEKYVNKDYPLVPLFDMEKIRGIYETHKKEGLHVSKKIYKCSKTEHHKICLTLSRSDLVKISRELAVSPFVIFTGVSCQLISKLTEQSDLLFGFATDMRHCLGVRNALYNCIAPTECRWNYEGERPDTRDTIVSLKEKTSESLDTEKLLKGMSHLIGTAEELYRLPMPFNKKARLFQMATGINKMDFYLTYVGNLFTNRKLKDHIVSCDRWTTGTVPYCSGIGVVEYGNDIKLCIEHFFEAELYKETLTSVLKEIGVNVLDYEEIGWIDR